MALVTLPYTFVANTTAVAAQVNSNFNAITAYLNNGSMNAASTGHAYLPGGILMQWGSASVASDGSAHTAFTYDISFPSSVFAIILSINNNFQSNNYELTAQYDTPTVTGFNANVAGGPASSSVQVGYIAIGI